MTLAAQSLTAGYGQRIVLNGIDIACARGRVTVVLGPNGAGKSTLLQCLAGLLPARAGAVRIGGVDLVDLAPRERARLIGYLPQDGVVHWSLDVEAVVALGRLPHRSPFAGPSDFDRAAITRAMTATGCQALAGRPVAQLSGGERARVLLARVLAGQPDWLLADEPLANLDPAHQLAVLDLLRAAARGGRGVVAVLHDLTQAARLADQIVLLGEAQVVATGPPADVLTAERLATVFGIRAHVGTAEDGSPIIAPLGPV